MKGPLQSFNELLEQYVFGMADKLIELADQNTQTKIIHLINKINSSSINSDSVTYKKQQVSVVLPKVKQEPPAEVFTKKLEKQWQEALRKAVPGTCGQYEQRTITIARLIAIHQINIDHTISHIRSVDILLERVEKNINNTHRNINIVNHYQSIKNKYIAYISKLQTLQKQEILRLKFCQ